MNTAAIASFYVLTLFSCPDNRVECSPQDLIPKVTKQFQHFRDCRAVGYTLVDLKRFEDFKCSRHERAKG